MAGVKVDRVLVQGTVTFTVRCNDLMGMVTPEQAADEDFMKDWFEDKAFKIIDSADVEVEYDNEVPVLISEETAQKHTDQVIIDDDWIEIRLEHQANEGSA
ncbi:hypothetical protein P9G84_22440 [Brevibacillus centrosporus]|uniref:hypothetical protein n=1 Tax=Brevibacillus centrosporus TaxID=54910 RepID=UPI000F09DD0F|nr:hypothetical protein [Brevibacillus centrosporus]MEC2131688.1 hypothetical protein [Brevibacillus centrosporus]RNB67335.1 hypothetical protein EDM55_20020 [Brevibacillus centrosporus]GED34017.1 hypothetical protein BCE02nite_51580 [Brevibacillus centrosporus]